MRFAISVAGAAALAALAFPADAKVLTYCADAAPQGFDPALYFDGATLDASAEALYDRLVEFGPGSTVLLPGLAQSWDVTPDGKTYTFHLRDNVAFSSTASFTLPPRSSAARASLSLLPVSRITIFRCRRSSFTLEACTSTIRPA